MMDMVKKEITIYDIASELNVSPSTVSRALRDHFSIGEATKRKVIELAAERGYRPQLGKKMATIGVIVSHVNQPLISSMISGIENVAYESGFSVIVTQSQNNVTNEVARAKSLYEARISGLIVSLAKETTDICHFKQFIEHNIPVVFLERKPKGINSDTVIVDYFNAAYLATTHLVEQGCRRIAFIGDTAERNVHSEKLNGYLRALNEQNLPANDQHVVVRDILGAEEGYSCATCLLNLSNAPDAIFAANDTAAVGVIQYAKRKGVRIPEDLAVVGFNDDPVSLIIDPPLSTVALPAVEMGKIAAQEVLDRNRAREMYVKSVALKAKLMVRKSSLRLSD